MAKHLLSVKEVANAKPCTGVYASCKCPPCKSHRAARKQREGAGPKNYRMADGDNLYLLVLPSGVKTWQLRYRDPDGKEQVASLGKLDKLSLAEARDKARQWGKLVKEGENLTAHKHATRTARHTASSDTFKEYAEGWIARRAKRKNWSEGHKAQVAALLANHLSELDRLPMTKITAAAVTPIIHGVEAKAPSAAKRARLYLWMILNDAVNAGAVVANPLPKSSDVDAKGENYPAVTALEPLGAILRAAEASDPCKGARRAHELLVFTAMRVANVVAARWSDFQLDGVEVPDTDAAHKTKLNPDAGTWTIPRASMKKKNRERGDHVVPLPPKLLAHLREWRKADGPDAIYVCHAPRDPAKHITPNTIGKHYRNALKLHGQHSPHSWRSAFKTISANAGKESEVIEAQLDHVVGNSVASAYDRANRLELRRELMAWYEGQLTAARDGATVLAFPSSGSVRA